MTITKISIKTKSHRTGELLERTFYVEPRRLSIFLENYIATVGPIEVLVLENITVWVPE